MQKFMPSWVVTCLLLVQAACAEDEDPSPPLTYLDASQQPVQPADGGLSSSDANVALPVDAALDAGSTSDASAAPDAAADAGPGEPPVPSGPVDGDPGKPIVAIPNIPCGPGGGLGPLGSANLKVGGRDVIVTYPCNKHEGAHVSVILLLHGTMPTEQFKYYTHGYFAAYQLATSHNLIVVEPKSVVQQWGNGDNGVDKPHLYEVINWVYTNFAKFNLTGLWVAGHSWGAMFAKTFVCDEMLRTRARGVIGMSGGTTKVGTSRLPGAMASGDCADRVSQIHTVGDQDSVAGLPDQSAAATKHGCGPKSAAMDLGGQQMMSEWPKCSPGWVHSEFMMGGHTHTTNVNKEIVLKIVEQIKATEKR